MSLQFIPMASPFRHRLVVTLAAALLLGTAFPGSRALQPRSFAAQVAALSEPPGYFDSDNLISNERSYLQVMPGLRQANVRGGAYIGVGPDQNFSYIADIRPGIAFIVDIRRDNLLLHLLFKALFAQAGTRADYMALLFGRRPPPVTGAWRAATIDRLAAYIDATPVDKAAASTRARIHAAIGRFGIPLSADDLSTIDRFHQTFVEAGLDLRFETTGRLPQRSYPAYRDLLLATDARGEHANFLASEESFQFVKSLEARNLVIPVVGDLGGPKALGAIGRLLDDRGDKLSAFYTSNVEFYLERAGTFGQFVDNLTRIPHTSGSVVVRSIFGRYNAGSTSVTERVDDVLARSR
jgi:hypothetical protein